ncbi:MAG: prepilin-type N-terminal cleavage/methylation domain-containing protein [Pyrinomonadaceae bacterium]
MTPDQYPTRRRSSAPVRRRSARQAASLKAQRGHSLVELLIVVVIIMIVASLAFARFSGREDGVRLGQDVARRIRERRAAAIQLNTQTTATQLQQFVQPPVTIDFADLATTRSLRLEGTDGNGDGNDDTSGLPLTHFIPPAAAGAAGTWAYAYEGSPLDLPARWRFASTAGDLSPIPAIPLGTPTTAISFTREGKVANLPAAAGTTDPARESPFPAVYLTDGSNAYAVAVHPTGLVEFWRWDASANAWKGYADRTVNSGG